MLKRPASVLNHGERHSKVNRAMQQPGGSASSPDGHPVYAFVHMDKDSLKFCRNVRLITDPTPDLKEACRRVGSVSGNLINGGVCRSCLANRGTLKEIRDFIDEELNRS